MPAVTLRRPLLSAYLSVFLLSVLTVQADTCLDRVTTLGFAELAATFPPEKALHLAPDTHAKPLDEQQACAVLTLLGRNSPKDFASPDAAWMGNLGEASIYPRLLPLWQDALNQARTPFTLDLRELIRRGLANGYNIATSPWPDFDPDRTLIYGHSDIRHAQQLLALLASEGMTARIGFSGKISAYLHREGWGEPPEFAIELGEGLFLIEAREYDLHLEFPDESGKQRFMVILSRYAKQQTDYDEPLIYGAWWQPFVRSYVVADGFEPVAQVDISSGGETAQILLSQVDAEQLAAQISDQDFNWSVAVRTVNVNPAFGRYLRGDFQ